MNFNYEDLRTAVLQIKVVEINPASDENPLKITPQSIPQNDLQSPSRPVQSRKVQLYIPEDPTGDPEYKVSWKTVACTVGAIALVATAIGAFVALSVLTAPVSVPLVALLVGSGIASLIGSGFFAAGAAHYQRQENIQTELEYSRSLPEGAQKLAWLHKAASHSGGFNEAHIEESKMLEDLKNTLLDSPLSKFHKRLDNFITWKNHTQMFEVSSENRFSQQQSDEIFKINMINYRKNKANAKSDQESKRYLNMMEKCVNDYAPWAQANFQTNLEK